MEPNKQGAILYQIRMDEGRCPSDLVVEMTHAAWKVLAGKESPGPLDPHRWPSLYRDFQRVLQKRMIRFPACGTLDACRYSVPVYGPAALAGADKRSVYLLRAKGGAAGLTRELAALAWRRFRRSLASSSDGPTAWRDRIEGAIHRTLESRLYYEEGCSNCPAISGPGDRRFWG
jgi:hypothetical protein